MQRILTMLPVVSFFFFGVSRDLAFDIRMFKPSGHFGPSSCPPVSSQVRSTLIILKLLPNSRPPLIF